MNPLSVCCIHPFCLAQPGEPCGTFDVTTAKMVPFLVDGEPGFHAERIADAGTGAVIVDKAIIDRAAEGLV